MGSNMSRQDQIEPLGPGVVFFFFGVFRVVKPEPASAVSTILAAILIHLASWPEFLRETSLHQRLRIIPIIASEPRK